MKGQALFDRLFIDEDKSYTETHNAAIEFEGNCYAGCDGMVLLKDGTLKAK